MTEEKVRAAIKIIIKELSIILGSFLIIIVTASVACVVSTYSEKKVEAKTQQQTKIVVQTETESQDLSEHQSTMSRMITGKEIAKGDRAVELEKIARKKARKRKIALNLMAHLINGEASDQNDACQQAVGRVVLNRIKDKDYPNTIRGVIFQNRQYACTDKKNSGYYKEPSKKVWKNAKAVLSGNTIIDVPDNVVFQAQFLQGSGLYMKIGTEYFCYK